MARRLGRSRWLFYGAGSGSLTSSHIIIRSPGPSSVFQGYGPLAMEKIAHGLGIEVGALLPKLRGLSTAGVEFATLFDEVKDRRIQAALLTILRSLPRRKGRRA